jgi:enoyl-CoA hydratase/carnithine racemase
MMQIENSPLLIKDGAKATVILNRPEHHNRIDPKDIPKIHEHLDAIESDHSIQMLVITGAGSKTFSSGYTINAILTRMDDSFPMLLGRIEKFNKPTLCALNGSVYGGGVDLATCCDFRIGVNGSRMFIPAAKFGLHYYPDGIRRFVQRVGPVAAKKIFMLGKTMEADEMLRVGFLNDLVQPTKLNLAIDDYLKSVLECENSVTMSMKKNIDAIVNGDLDTKTWIDRYCATLSSKEMAERLKDSSHNSAKDG